MASFIAFSLIGCEEKVVTKKYEGTKDKIKIEAMYTAKGDNITKSVEKVSIKYADIGAQDQEQKDAVKNEMNKDIEKINKFKGVKANLESNNDGITLTADIDYTKADIKELNSNEITKIDGADDTKSISLEKTDEQMKKDGFKEVK
ncbi:DUF1307 domain-containing protein [Peptostreptococcus equinus]|uniref:DUF1307 domain-containing protein n=1 Tax=Peptostreptococcus equinus TaxID=3003601 RepID=A0ABY7JQB8_9FIRM|nr:DUF1307 domain-containing protein [Peptostreptococcus sp. CBA3647]WAW15550.1 DUF1307 domain-containing protein [Peptostreptococcus sp. CBA3647]